jgi:hypothetical protein
VLSAESGRFVRPLSELDHLKPATDQAFNRGLRAIVLW